MLNCVSFVDLLLRFYQMPELSVKAGTLAWTDIQAFKNMVIKQVMAKLSDKLLTHFFRHSRILSRLRATSFSLKSHLVSLYFQMDVTTRYSKGTPTSYL